VSFDPDYLEQLVACDAALDALGHAERAYAELPHDPTVQSYYGFLMAAERGRLRHGLELCELALGAPEHSVLVELNAARAYIKAGRKPDAVRCLQGGLARAPGHVLLVQELARLGTRQAPVLPWLPRRSWLNKQLGLIAVRLGLR